MSRRFSHLTIRYLVAASMLGLVIVLGAIAVVLLLADARQPHDETTSHALEVLIISAAVIAAVTGTILGYLFFRSLNDRLRRLSSASIAISHGDYSEDDLEGDKALGDVADAFVAMRRCVEERDYALRRFNELLQDEIDKRTDELTVAKETAEEAVKVLRETNKELIEQATQREASEKRLRESQERYALASRGANDGLWDWDIEAGTLYTSSRWQAIVGYEEDELGDEPKQWLDRVHESDRSNLDKAIDEHLAGSTPYFECEYRIRHRTGGYRWVLSRGLAVRDESEKPYRFAGSMTDITERRSVEERFRHRAMHDELTGLPNRSLLMDRLDSCLKRARRDENYIFGLFFFDLDRFKLINDSLGHAAGDKLLIEFAHRLRTGLRASDTVSRNGDSAVARLGGDEFVVLLDTIKSVDDCARIAERLHASLYKPFYLDDQEVFITGSIGVAIGSGESASASDLLRDADMAMYRAKSEGRNRFEIFDKQMHEQAVTRLQLENDLRRALEGAQFRLQYQAIVDARSGNIKGFEALIRWDHPTRGFVSPAQFIPMAEETGQIVPIGAWVLRQACDDLMHWRTQIPQAKDLSINVNLSKRQISEPGLVATVKEVIQETGIPPECLKLEITESVIMEASEDLIPVLHELRDLGCELHMDDFGTGYSSLSCLHRFPLDVIKIDRAFIVNMTEDKRYAAVVNAIVILAHSLGMRVTAEGVETNEQLAQVLALECDFSQGYYFSKPTGRFDTVQLLESDLPWLSSAIAV